MAGARCLVHYRMSCCLLKVYDRGHGPGGLEPEDRRSWFELGEGAFRYAVGSEVGREELTALIQGSTAELAEDEHKADHSAAGDFARWSRLGGLETLRHYGRPRFSLLWRRRWNKIGADALAAHRADRLAAKPGQLDASPRPSQP